ncbi:MAG: hypothetical protein AB7P69_29365 [Candidatus Binatia bacterium]
MGLRRDLTISLSERVKFASEEIVLKVTARIASQPQWAAAVTPKNGASLSWEATLETR